jgi:ketosteroid isomerase-like protein
MNINAEDVLLEVRAAVDRYEAALMTNDLQALDDFFWASEHTVRFGIAENLYGIEEIRRFRVGRGGGSPTRERTRTHIVALGRDLAVAHVEFRRHDSERRGRQTQTWTRTPDGWKVVSAHVSLLQDTVDHRNSRSASLSGASSAS